MQITLETANLLIVSQKYQELYDILAGQQDPVLQYKRAIAAVGLNKNREAMLILFRLLKIGKLGVLSLLLPLLVKLEQKDRALQLVEHLAAKVDTSQQYAWQALIYRAAGEQQMANDIQWNALTAKKLELGERFQQLTAGQKAKIFSHIVFTGGAADLFTEVGQRTLAMLVEQGLKPQHHVLDIGSGCLRCGIPLINYLQPERYCGIEPNLIMQRFGQQYLLSPEQQSAKKPRFDDNKHFDFSTFDKRFDVFVARSIWTHTSRQQIQQCLDSFGENRNPGGVFFASMIPTSNHKEAYLGDEWLGLSDSSLQVGYAYHPYDWLETQCQARGLQLQELSEHHFNDQIWLRIQ